MEFLRKALASLLPPHYSIDTLPRSRIGDKKLLSDSAKLARYFEGYKSYIYDDKTGHAPILNSGGKITIGTGYNLSDRGLPDDILEELLQRDLAMVLDQCRLTFSHFDKLSYARQLVYLDMTYNMGISRFAKFKRTHESVRKGLYEQAGRQMLDSLWAVQVGPRRSKPLVAMMKWDRLPEDILNATDNA